MSDLVGPGTGLPTGAAMESLTYEQLVDSLEDLARRMAAGDVGIEEAAELYEQAGLIHRLASERLERVRRRIEDLEEDAAPGPTGSP
ncbi:MAG: exodeoxyribonuclease VII small subunit [Acidimicrobiales bacterium]|nr:MAG: exodeoxyribonuclease VII small subunit [Acidimicrobiales bacterium]